MKQGLVEEEILREMDKGRGSFAHLESPTVHRSIEAFKFGMSKMLWANYCRKKVLVLYYYGADVQIILVSNNRVQIDINDAALATNPIGLTTIFQLLPCG